MELKGWHACGMLAARIVSENKIENSLCILLWCGVVLINHHQPYLLAVLKLTSKTYTQIDYWSRVSSVLDVHRGLK